jgi:hypothetical protein
MNILKKIVLVGLVLIGSPMISLATITTPLEGVVSCSPQYSDDYINKTVTWNAEIIDDSQLGSNLSYSWSFVDGTPSTGTDITATNTYLEKGLKTATLIVTGDLNSAIATCSVQIYDETNLPALTVNSCDADDLRTATVGQPVTWFSRISGGLAPYTVNWSGDASGVGESITENYTATGTKTAQITNVASRYSDLPVSTTTVVCSPSVKVYSNAPEINPSTSLEGVISCSPQYSDDYINKTVTWNAEIMDGSGLGDILSYNWVFDGGLTSEGLNATSSFGSKGVKQAILEVTGSLANTKTTCSVQIYDETNLPALTVNSCDADDLRTATVGQPVTWFSRISGGLAPYTVNWSGDASGVGESITENYTATGTKTAQITSVASRYSDLPVSTTTVVCSPSVKVYPRPSSQVFVDNGTTCSVSNTSIKIGESVNWSVDLKTLNGVGPYIISWTGSDGLSGTSTSISKTYSTAGTKTAKIYSITSSDAQSIESDIICSNSVSVSESQNNPVSYGGGGGGSFFTPIQQPAATPINEVAGVDETSIEDSTDESVLSSGNTNKFKIYNPFIFNNDESFGAINEDVANLQNRLAQEGFFDDEITGYFGPITETSVKAYQQANGLEVTGKLDFETRSKLNGVVEDIATSTAVIATSTTGDLDLTATVFNSSDWMSSKWTWILLAIAIIIIFFIIWKRRKEDKNN